MILRTALATLGIGLALGVSPMAHADPQTTQDADQIFFTGLMMLGMDVSDPPLAKQQGLQICGLLNQGVPSDTILTSLMSTTGYTLSEASALSTVAKFAYCPEISGKAAA